MKKGFDIEPVYNKKYLKTRIKPCNNKIKSNFYGDCHDWTAIIIHYYCVTWF